jgi:hypothetical protein
MALLKSDPSFSSDAASAIDSILHSSTLIIGLRPNVILDLSQYEHELKCLKNVSADELIKKFFTTEDPDWLFVVTFITLRNAVAVFVTEETLMVYDKKEPLHLNVRVPVNQVHRLISDLISPLLYLSKNMKLCLQ